MREFLELSIPILLIILSLGVLIINTNNIVSVINTGVGNLLFYCLIHIIISAIFVESANILDRRGT